MPPLTVDVFSDVVCPFCFVGATRLDRALATLGLEGTDKVEVRYFPFFLSPQTPESGENIPEKLRARHGRDPKPMFAHVEQMAKESGLDLDLSRQPMSYPTRKAQTLLRLADKKGTQRALAMALFQTYFLEAKNISEDAVLVPLAERFGFGADEARALLHDEKELATTAEQAQAAAQEGITGVPFYVLNGKYGISGAQPEEVFVQSLQQAMAG